MAEAAQDGQLLLILGDSFVHRLQSCLKQNPAPVLDQLKAPMAVSEIFFYGIGGAGATPSTKQLHIPKDLILALAPKYVILEIGGNDVDSEANPEEIAQHKLTMAKELLGLGVRMVVLTTILPRDVTRTIPAIHYRAKAESTNNYTSFLVNEDPQSDHLLFHAHRGFWRDANHNITDTTSWSTDGIHPDTQSGIAKYRASITSAIHKLIKTDRTRFPQ